MPVVTIQSPTGQSFKIEAPEGATDEQILSFAKSQGLFDQPVNQQPTQPAQQEQQEQPIQNEGAGFGANVLGAIENVGSLISGAVAEPISGFAGIVQGLNPFADEGASSEAVKGVRDFLTYDPLTDAGKSQQRSIGETLAPVGEALKSTESYLGENVLKLTGSPALASMAHTLPTAVLEILGLKGARKATAVGVPSASKVRKTLIDSAPDVDKIKNASRAIFKELDESGVAINQTALKRLESNLDNIAKKEGIRERVTPEAFGAIDEVKKDIAAGNPLPISQLDELRTVAKNSIVASDANKARAGSRIVDEIDDFLNDIKSTDIQPGSSVSAADVGKKYGAARKLWGRAKRSEMLQDAIEMGASRKAGIEKGIRNELNNLLNRKKSRKFLNKEDVDAIRKVTDGDFKQNFASLIGGMGLKLENSPSLFASIVGGGGAGAIASQAGVAGAFLPAAIGAITVGTISKEIAKKITKNRAGFLDTMARAGTDGERIVKAYLKSVPKKSQNINDLSNLLIDQSVDIGGLEKIANDTVRRAVDAAKFKRDIVQSITAASVGAASGANNSENAKENGK